MWAGRPRPAKQPSSTFSSPRSRVGTAGPTLRRQKGAGPGCPRPRGRSPRTTRCPRTSSMGRMGRMGPMGPMEKMPAWPPIDLDLVLDLDLLFPSVQAAPLRPPPVPSAHPPRPSCHASRSTRNACLPGTSHHRRAMIFLPLYLGDRTFAYADPGCKPCSVMGLQRGACAFYHYSEIRDPRQPCVLSGLLTGHPRVDAMDEVDSVDSDLGISCPSRPRSPFRPFFRHLRGCGWGDPPSPAAYAAGYALPPLRGSPPPGRGLLPSTYHGQTSVSTYFRRKSLATIFFRRISYAPRAPGTPAPEHPAPEPAHRALPLHQEHGTDGADHGAAPYRSRSRPRSPLFTRTSTPDPRPFRPPSTPLFLTRDACLPRTSHHPPAMIFLPLYLGDRTSAYAQIRLYLLVGQALTMRIRRAPGAICHSGSPALHNPPQPVGEAHTHCGRHVPVPRNNHPLPFRPDAAASEKGWPRSMGRMGPVGHFPAPPPIHLDLLSSLASRHPTLDPSARPPRPSS